MIDIVIGCLVLGVGLVILGYGLAFFFKEKDEEKLGISALAAAALAVFSMFFLKTCDNGMLVSWPDKYEGITRPVKYGNEKGEDGVRLDKPATTQPGKK